MGRASREQQTVLLLEEAARFAAKLDWSDDDFETAAMKAWDAVSEGTAPYWGFKSSGSGRAARARGSRSSSTRQSAPRE